MTKFKWKSCAPFGMYISNILMRLQIFSLFQILCPIIIFYSISPQKMMEWSRHSINHSKDSSYNPCCTGNELFILINVAQACFVRARTSASGPKSSVIQEPIHLLCSPAHQFPSIQMLIVVAVFQSDFLIFA